MLLLSMLLWLAGLQPLGAQLAITEAMSWASTNCGGVWHPSHADFWELTNFGSQTNDLSNYLFCDRDRNFPEGAWPIPEGTRIAPSESIVFVGSGNGTEDAAAFVAWWGAGNLPSNPQIIFYPNGYGFDQTVDAVRLWDANSNLVDAVFLGEATRGVTFTYETNFGEFGLKSVPGVRGAFVAAECTDVGSPATNVGRAVAMQITRQPVSQVVDAGTELFLSVEACGLPRPRGYVWYHNGTAVLNIRAPEDFVPTVVNYAGCGLAWKTSTKATDLIIPKVEASDAGQYFVVLTNGLEVLTSAVVTVTVNTDPSPPTVECPAAELRFPEMDGRPQTNLTVTPWQTAQFAVIARGYPLPRMQWSWSADGTRFVNIPNATNATLSIPYVQPSHAGL